jgi:tight adherence protein B
MSGHGLAGLTLLRNVASLLLPLGLSSLGACLLRSSAMRERAAAYEARLAYELRYLQATLDARRIVLGQLGVGSCFVALSALCNLPWLLLALAWVAVGPRLWLQRQRRLRSARIEEQLDSWLLLLSNALKANPSLGEAIAESARLMAAPLKQELSLALKENHLGMPLDRALRQLTERVKSPVVSAAIATLRVARNSGGNLSETLEAAAASLREMARLEGVVRTKTAEGRAQSLLIGGIPVPLVWMLHSLNPTLLAPLWLTARGHLVLGIACSLWLTALLWARKIVAVEI